MPRRIKRKDGRHTRTLSLADGRRKFFYADTLSEVDAKWAAAKIAIEKGQPLQADERIRLSAFLDRWMEHKRVNKTISPLCFSTWSYMIETHIKPALGQFYITRLTPVMLQQFFTGKLQEVSIKTGKSLSPSYVKGMRTILRSALQQAMKWELVGRNVASLTDAIPVPETELLVLNEAQAYKLLQATEGTRMHAVYAVSLMLGLRQGELLGLRWEDVDLENGCLNIKRQLQYIKSPKDKKAIPKLLPLKTRKSRRTLPLPPLLIKALDNHKLIQAEERRIQGSRWQEFDLVFPTIIGTPQHDTNFYKWFKHLIKRLELPDIRWHDLRHTSASLMISIGIPIHHVSEILGHSNITETINTYRHILDSQSEKAAAAIEEFWTADIIKQNQYVVKSVVKQDAMEAREG